MKSTLVFTRYSSKRGVAYPLKGGLPAAAADLSKAIGDRGKARYRAALYERGVVYRKMGNIAEARADFERILELERQSPGEADKAWADKTESGLATLGK